MQLLFLHFDTQGMDRFKNCNKATLFTSAEPTAINNNSFIVRSSYNCLFQCYTYRTRISGTSVIIVYRFSFFCAVLNLVLQCCQTRRTKCTRCQNKDRNRLICIRKYLEIKDFPEPISSLTIPMEVRPTVIQVPFRFRQTDGSTGFWCITRLFPEWWLKHYDQRNIKSQWIIQTWNNPSSKTVRSLQDATTTIKCRHTYGIRNDLTQRVDQHIGQHQYYGCRKSIPIPLIAEVVTASVGHIPSIRTKVGFSWSDHCKVSLYIYSLIMSHSYRQSILKYISAESTALVTALVVIVVPLMPR